MINITVIESLKPCRDRRENYRKFYGEKMLTRGQFMGLKNITQSDKEWVVFRLLPKDKIVLAVTDIAESVLYIYEEKYPNDLRPRKAIEAARRGTVTEVIRHNAYAAANAANADAYTAADAYNAYTAAAYAAAYAAYTAAYAATNAAFYSVRASSDRPQQEKLIRKILLKYWSQSAKETK